MSGADRARRALLQGLVVAIGGDPAPWRRWRRGPAAAEASAGLSSADVEDLLAFAGVLATGGPLTEGERRDLLGQLEQRRPDSPDDQQALYRTAVQVLARLAGARFATLDPAQREAVVRRHRLAEREAAPDDGPSADDLRLVRTRVVPGLIGAFYRSPAGWAVVDYAVFPGRCGDLQRYTRAET